MSSISKVRSSPAGGWFVPIVMSSSEMPVMTTSVCKWACSAGSRPIRFECVL